jgi:hypothetical protein
MDRSTDLHDTVLFLFLRRLLGFYNGHVNTYFFCMLYSCEVYLFREIAIHINIVSDEVTEKYKFFFFLLSYVPNSFIAEIW